MQNSVGLVEVCGSSNAIYIMDVMLKAADVRFLAWKTVYGIGYMTILVQGDVSSVKAAVEAAKNNEKYKIFASYVIANPHPETKKFLKRLES